MIQNIIKFILLTFTFLLFTGCEVWDYGEHPQVTAVKKIAEYADSNSSKAPDANLYKDAGVNIDSADINATNHYIKTLGYSDVDTREEIQNVVDNLGAYTNEKPTAKISVQSNIVEAGELILLDAIESTDSDGEIVSYEWKEGEKLLETGIAYDANLSKGRHIIELIVTDDYNATDIDRISVVVKDVDDNGTTTTINQPPEAIIKVIDNNSSSITLESISTDDKRIVKHQWKEGSKVLATGKKYEVTKKGKHTITLTVTDDDNKTDTATAKIEVK